MKFYGIVVCMKWNFHVFNCIPAPAAVSDLNSHSLSIAKPVFGLSFQK